MKLSVDPAHAIVTAHAVKAVRATGRVLKNAVLQTCGPEYLAVASHFRWDEIKSRIESMIGGGLTPIGRDDPTLETTEPWRVLPSRHNACIGYTLASKSPGVAEAHFYRRWNQATGSTRSVMALALTYQADGVPLNLPVPLTSLDLPRLAA